MRDIPLNNRTTVRRLAAALDVPRSTLHENLKALGLRAHSNAIKPFLTDAGKLERVRRVLRWVGVSSTSSAVANPAREIHHFVEDFVHVDEKWFYLFVDGQRFLR